MSTLINLFSITAMGGVFALPEYATGMEALIAYVGPGAGLSMIGALIAVACVILLALIGPLLYPIRMIHRLIRRRKEQSVSIDARQRKTVLTKATRQTATSQR